MTLLITGGLGFIGSHTVVELLATGYDVVILDNLSNSKPSVLDAIEQITGKRPVFYQGSVCDEKILGDIFDEHEISGVIHFAGKKAVGESCVYPWLYYENNVYGLITLTKIMQEFGVKKCVFSSSCTVYDPQNSAAPFDESAPTGNNFSPYGTTKQMCEMIFRDLSLHKGRSCVNLRYFNPIGAHPSGRIGEDSAQPPTNLLPVIFQVLANTRPYLEIFGDTYETPDGTCLRDYINIVDLAQAHVMTRKWLSSQNHTYESINLGTGTPTSVKELVAIVEKVTTKSVPVRIVAPRAGDIPVAYASITKAKQLLGREATYTVEDAVRDGWRYVREN